MIESGYYPAGAEFDGDSPWNQQTPPKEEFNIEVVTTLSRPDTKVYSVNYNMICDDYNKTVEVDTSNINWNEEYINEYYTIPELLEMLKNDTIDKMKYTSDCRLIDKYQKIIDSCSNWNIVETTYYE